MKIKPKRVVERSRPVMKLRPKAPKAPVMKGKIPAKPEPVKDDSTESVSLCRLYFVNGRPPVDWKHLNYEIRNPPAGGFAVVLVLQGPGRAKTIFHPPTLSSFKVSENAGELMGAEYLPLNATVMRRDILAQVRMFRSVRNRFSMVAVRRVLSALPQRQGLKPKTV